MQENKPVRFEVECSSEKHIITIRDGWQDPENPGLWRRGEDGHIVDANGVRSPRGDSWMGDVWPLLQMHNHQQDESEGKVALILMGAKQEPSCCQFMLEIYGQDDSGKGVQRLSLDRSWWSLVPQEEKQSRKKAKASA